jgi:hypothetical protein
MVTGTRPLSPENVMVPSESTRTSPMSSASSRSMSATSSRPRAVSVRQAADSARSSAAAYGSLMPVGSSMIEVKDPRRSAVRAICSM